MKALQFVLLLAFCTPVFGQNLSKEASLFIKKHTSVLSRDKNFQLTDWKNVLKDVRKSRLVLIGEANHGSREMFEVRNSLIRSLHKKLDFDVILFESGIGELILPNCQKATKTAAELTRGLFGIWQTSAFEELMAFVKEEEIEIAGFDVQRSGGSFQYLLQECAGQALIPSARYTNIENRFSSLSKSLSQRKPYEELKDETESLIRDYHKLAAELKRKSPYKKTKKYKLTQRVLQNRIGYLSYYLNFVKDKDWNKRWAARDSIMASNVAWLAEEIYPKKKIIIIGHNYHIAKYNEKELVMGELLKETYGDTMSSIGVFARSGRYAGNYREEKKIEAPEDSKLNLKHAMAEIDAFATYLKIPKKPGKGNEWLFHKIEVEDTFINLSGDKYMNLSLHFDGLIFLDEVSLPNFISQLE